MSYERSKAPLALMEQIIMILVFALAAAACLQAFVYASRVSEEGEKRDLAIVRVQELAEYSKYVHGDMARIRSHFSGEASGQGVTVSYPEDGMQMSLSVISQDEWMEKASVCMKDMEGTVIYEVTAAWQKEGRTGS